MIEDTQLKLFDQENNFLLQLRGINHEELTPMEAMDLVTKLIEGVKV